MNLALLEKEVITLCDEVGEFMNKELAGFDRTRIEQKGSSSNLVSYVDKESERRLVERLSKLLPGSGFIAEEGTDKESSNDYTWIIDPLDGTTNYLHGLPLFAISIGLQKKKQHRARCGLRC